MPAVFNITVPKSMDNVCEQASVGGAALAADLVGSGSVDLW